VTRLANIAMATTAANAIAAASIATATTTAATPSSLPQTAPGMSCVEQWMPPPPAAIASIATGTTLRPGK
jgi:hypothetical protein